MSCEVFNNSDFGMIEGSQQTITLDLYTILGEEFKNVAIESVEWRMSRYGETECLASKTSTDSPNEVKYEENVITITLLPSDTMNLFGKFTHQIIIRDIHSSIFVADLGKISIKPLIK